MFEKGAVISENKICGVIGDLINSKRNDLLDLVFERIDYNNAKIADYLLHQPEIMDKFPEKIKDIYSNTTSPEIITFLYNNYCYKKQYEHKTFPIEQLILSKIAKNVNKPIKEIVNDFLNEER